MKYQWVKLPRSCMPQGKGLMGAWARLAARAAFRKGHAVYCGHRNAVTPGVWSGGIVGLKSILGVKSRTAALKTLNALSALGYLTYTLDPKTRQLSYQITDWVANCTGEACMGEAVYATDGYGFLCLPRSITGRLAAAQYKFEEADAWMDLWCHTVWQEPDNAFSFLSPAIQYGRNGAVLTLEALGRRWGWEKTKVWRFFQKHGDALTLYRLPGRCGCLIFNRLYPAGAAFCIPSQAEIVRILARIRICGKNTHKAGTDHAHLNRLIARFSRQIIARRQQRGQTLAPKTRVALSSSIIRAYLSLRRSWKNCMDDCKGKRHNEAKKQPEKVRGPCGPVDLTKIAKECFTWEPIKAKTTYMSSRKPGCEHSQTSLPPF